MSFKAIKPSSTYNAAKHSLKIVGQGCQGDLEFPARANLVGHQLLEDGDLYLCFLIIAFQN